MDGRSGFPYPSLLVSHGNNATEARFFCLVHSHFSPFSAFRLRPNIWALML
jgi:hypothetical protein